MKPSGQPTTPTRSTSARSVAPRALGALGATVAAIALTASAPAVAVAEAAPVPLDPAARSAPGLEELRVVGPLERVAEPLRRRAERVRRAEGPFNPVVGAVDYGTASNAFGNARGRPHEGQDMLAAAGSPVISPSRSIVLETGSDGGRGNWASAYDPSRDLTFNFFHLQESASVEAGQRLDPGERIGRVGCSGSCSGDHLHFEIRRGEDPYGETIDPLPFLQRSASYDGGS